MRKFFGFLAIALFVCAGAASAAPLASGSLSFTIGTLPPILVPITGGFTANGIKVTATAANAIVGSQLITGITNAQPITAVQGVVTGNQLGTLTPGAGTAANGLAIKGVSNVLGYGGSVTLVAAPLMPVGSPGSTFMTSMFGNIIEYTGMGWTTGPVTIMIPATTIAGMVDPANARVVMATGTKNLNNGVGTITFVSPLLIRTNVAGDVPAFAALKLTFAPEPAALVQSGAAALGVLGVAVWRRRRASR